MANSNGWGDGAANNTIGWGQGANNNIGWGSSHATSWASATDIVGLTTDPAASAFIAATGITNTTEQLAIDNLVKGLKADGLWTKMKAVYPFVTDNRNLLGYTEDFSNAYWGKLNSTVTSNSITAPDGTLTADTFTGSSATSYIYTNTPISSIGNNTFSIYVKAGSLTSFSLDFATSNFQYGGSSIINLTTGTAGAITYYGGASGWTTNVESVGNGWYRCSIGGNIATTQNMYCEIMTNIGNLFIWGAQLELGSTATTYQPIATTQQAFISSQFKYNLVNPVDSDAAFRLVFNGGWTHSSNGATPNGTNGYADSKILGGTDLTTNNSGIGIYSGTQSLKNGGFGTGLAFHIYPRFTDSNTYYRIMNIGGGFINNLSSLGFIHGYSNASNGYGFYNSNKVRTMNKSAEIDTANLFFGGQRPSIAEYDNKQLRFAFASQYLTDTEAANLYTRVQAFQTSLSRQV